MFQSKNLVFFLKILNNEWQNLNNSKESVKKEKKGGDLV